MAHALPHVAEDAELLTSELVSNAIRHSGTLITVVAVCHDAGRLIVNVRDDGPGVEPVAELPAADAEAGRGLQLVDRVAGRWGTIRHDAGKSVWFRLP